MEGRGTRCQIWRRSDTHAPESLDTLVNVVAGVVSRTPMVHGRLIIRVPMRGSQSMVALGRRTGSTYRVLGKWTCGVLTWDAQRPASFNIASAVSRSGSSRPGRWAS
jgi:hypothetical protein